MERIEEKPKGATLALAESLPPEESELLGVAHKEKSRIRTARVLVIEDEKDVALSVMKRLKYAGFDVSVAGDGVAATAAAFQFQPDVVILDIGLPCGDGFEVANRLRENVVTAITPIIFLTARTSELDRQKAESLGAFAYMTKPFKSEELVSTIEEALGS